MFSRAGDKISSSFPVLSPVLRRRRVRERGVRREMGKRKLGQPCSCQGSRDLSGREERETGGLEIQVLIKRREMAKKRLC